MSFNDMWTTIIGSSWGSETASETWISTGSNITAATHVCWHRHAARVRRAKRHDAIVCTDCGEDLARVSFDPPAAPLVLRDRPPAARVTRAPAVLRVSVERRHRASPRRFVGFA